MCNIVDYLAYCISLGASDFGKSWNLFIYLECVPHCKIVYIHYFAMRKRGAIRIFSAKLGNKMSGGEDLKLNWSLQLVTDAAAYNNDNNTYNENSALTHSRYDLLHFVKYHKYS